MAYFSHKCDGCGEIHTAEFWEDFAETWHKSDHNNDAIETRDMSHLKFTMNHRLCCDNVPANCECEEPIEWEDSYDVDPEIYWNVYDTDEDDSTLCIKCEHYFAVTCVPLRKWLKAFSLENIYSGKISEFCGNFMLDTPVSIKEGVTRTGQLADKESIN